MRIDRLRRLQTQLVLEQDPVKKQDLQEQLLDLIQEGFIQLLSAIAKEGDPDRLRLFVDQLNDVIEGRRINRKNQRVS